MRKFLLFLLLLVFAGILGYQNSAPLRHWLDGNLALVQKTRHVAGSADAVLPNVPALPTSDMAMLQTHPESLSGQAALGTDSVDTENQQRAQVFVDTLPADQPPVISIKNASHFVSGRQLLELPMLPETPLPAKGIRLGALPAGAMIVQPLEVDEQNAISEQQPVVYAMVPEPEPDTVSTESLITLTELMQFADEPEQDSIYYVRTVRQTDIYGIWGILFQALSDNFRDGMTLDGTGDNQLYQVEIPTYADEKLPGNSSSFLGKILDNKTRESYVFNFSSQRMGRNPDMIYPGQELVIVNFRRDELVAIYQHFNH